jgi:YD repeat-containing protein
VTEFTRVINANGTLASMADAKGNVTRFEYDGFKRATVTRFPLASNGTQSSTTDFQQISYAPNGRVASVRLRDGQVINLGYDALGRITTKSGAIAESMGFDNFSQLTSHTNNGVTETYNVNALGQMVSAIGPMGTIGYQYDIYGRRTRLTYTDGFYVTYGFNEADELTGIFENGSATLASFDYDDFGRRFHLYRGNGQTTTYSYDSQSRLTTLSNAAASTGTNAISLGYTEANQIKSRDQSNTAAFAGALYGGYMTLGAVQQSEQETRATAYENRLLTLKICSLE